MKKKCACRIGLGKQVETSIDVRLERLPCDKLKFHFQREVLDFKYYRKIARAAIPSAWPEERQQATLRMKLHAARARKLYRLMRSKSCALPKGRIGF